ncbi:MAG: alpha/beta fold hydrolase [Actinomycetota bacterium]|nr:alpha/beta fold hydrolase [Actinomycetota bacterium]
MSWADSHGFLPGEGVRQREHSPERWGPQRDVGLPSEAAAPRYDAIIPAADGSRLTAEVWPATGSRRAIVFVHGFCGNRSENGLFHELARACSSRGLNAVLYDWRGIGHSGGDFCSTSLRDHVADFEHVLRWARKQFGATVESLSAVGFSLGAAVIGSALRDGNALNSIAYLSPAVRPSISMWPRYDTPHIARQLAERGVAEKPGSSVLLGRPILESLRTTDLGPSAFDVDVPLLVCHGTEDTRIDCSHTRELVAARNVHSAGSAAAFRYEEFDGASHSFRPHAEHVQRLASTLVPWFAEAHSTVLRRSSTG